MPVMASPHAALSVRASAAMLGTLATSISDVAQPHLSASASPYHVPRLKNSSAHLAPTPPTSPLDASRQSRAPLDATSTSQTHATAAALRRPCWRQHATPPSLHSFGSERHIAHQQHATSSNGGGEGKRHGSVRAPVAPISAVSARTSAGAARLAEAPVVGQGTVTGRLSRYDLMMEGLVDGQVCHILDRPSKKQVCLFYCSEMEGLARSVAGDTDNIDLKPIKWGKFADGFPDLFIPNAHGIRGRHVAFLASFSSPSVIFEQLSVIYALPRMFVSSFTLVLPFFPTGTSERMEDEGDVATANTLSRILSNIPICRGGPTSLVIFDIHALQERFYFGDNVLPCFESGIPLLKHRLLQLPDSDHVTIAFPDEGAWKRFHKQLQHYPMVICTKVRDGDRRIVQLKEGEPMGRHVVIVDDLVQSGSTLIECQRLLARHSASRVSAYVTHGVFPNQSWKRFTRSNTDAPSDGFTHFWITDSCPATAAAVTGREPFEILSLARSIQAALQV